MKLYIYIYFYKLTSNNENYLIKILKKKKSLESIHQEFISLYNHHFSINRTFAIRTNSPFRLYKIQTAIRTKRSKREKFSMDGNDEEETIGAIK